MTALCLTAQALSSSRGVMLVPTYLLDKKKPSFEAGLVIHLSGFPLTPLLSPLKRTALEIHNKRMGANRGNVHSGQNFVIVPVDRWCFFFEGLANLPTQDSLDRISNRQVTVFPSRHSFFAYV